MFTLCDMARVTEQFRFVTLVLYECWEHFTFYDAGGTVTLKFCDNVHCVVTVAAIKPDLSAEKVFSCNKNASNVEKKHDISVGTL
jgi:hypothetical protein